MNDNSKKYAPGIDWAYLVFIFLITNQAMLSLKVLGVLFIYALRPDFDFGFKKGRIPLFYPLILIFSVVAFVLHTRDFSKEYLGAFFVGNLFWLFGLLAFHQTRISLEKYGPQGMYRLLKAFTVFNLLFSIYQLVDIMIITGKFNPYSKLPFPYGMSTGDNIFGFFMENSYYNMMVSAVLAIYFLYKRNIWYSLIATTTLILVFGNFGTIVFIAILVGMLLVGITVRIFNAKEGSFLHNIAPRGNYGLYIPGIMVYILLFFALMSPENMDYVVEKIQSKVFSVQNSGNSYANLIKENKKPSPDAFDPYKQEEEVIVGKAPLHSLSEHTSVLGTISSPKQARKKMSDEYIQKLQGKALSIKETSQFLKSSVGNLLFGAGTARFSSLTAQKVGGYDSSRIFMTLVPRFTAPVYAQNHKLLIQSRYEAANEYRSNANWPDSVYNQIMGEYGLIGAALFIIFYIWYFVKRIKYFTYSFWVLAMMIPFGSLSYMFEALSIVIIFEAMTIADIEGTRQRLKHVATNN